MDHNPTFINYTQSITKDPEGNTLLNVTVYSFKTIYNHIFMLQIEAPDSNDDTEYRRLVFRSKMDLVKLLGGVRGNLFISAFHSTMKKFIDFELKAPFSPGYYRLINLTLPALFPQNTKTTVNISSDFGQKKRIWVATLIFKTSFY